MGITHYIKARSGDTYTDRAGVEKESYVQIGRMIETAKGNKVIILDCIPFAWLSGGKPVAMYLQAYEPRAAANGNTGVPPPAAAAKPKQTDFDDDIPF